MTISNFFCLYTYISCINLCHILFTPLFLHPHSVGYFSKKKKEGAKNVFIDRVHPSFMLLKILMHKSMFSYFQLGLVSWSFPFLVHLSNKDL